MLIPSVGIEVPGKNDAKFLGVDPRSVMAKGLQEQGIVPEVRMIPTLVRTQVNLTRAQTSEHQSELSPRPSQELKNTRRPGCHTHSATWTRS